MRQEVCCTGSPTVVKNVKIRRNSVLIFKAKIFQGELKIIRAVRVAAQRKQRVLMGCTDSRGV